LSRLVDKLLRNLNVLNLLLLVVTLGFAVNRLAPLIDSRVIYKPPPVKATPLKSLADSAPPGPTVNPLEYTVIAEQNLFHPERKIPPEKKAEAPLPKPEFVLYGTLITGDLAVAYLDDKKAPQVTTPGRGKRQTALKKGESLSGYVLKEIQADRVTMTRGEETLMVNLNDPQNPKAREGVAEPPKPGSPPRMPTAPAAARPTPANGAQPAGAGPGAQAPAARPGLVPGTPAPAPGISGAPTSGTVTPSRPRYRPLPPAVPAARPSAGPYPAPTPGSSRPYP
jgi:type II secretory pathway component PulC